MHVALCRRQVLVSDQFLNGPCWSAPHREMRTEGVPQDMDAMMVQPGQTSRPPNTILDHLLRAGALAVPSIKCLMGYWRKGQCCGWSLDRSRRFSSRGRDDFSAEADRGTAIALRSITIAFTFRDSPDQTLELSLPPPDTWTDPRFQDLLRRMNFPETAASN